MMVSWVSAAAQVTQQHPLCQSKHEASTVELPTDQQCVFGSTETSSTLW